MQATRVLMLGVLLVLLATAMAGCQEQLFGANDGYRRSTIDKYYNGDSAVETRATRFRAADNGFGYPTGMANQ